MLPEVQKYFDTTEQNRTDFQNARRDVSYDHDNKTGLSYRDIRNKRYAADTAAWNALKDSDNKLVKWIANNETIRNEYRENGEKILALLPCTLDVLDNHAKTSGWCGTWDDFRADAIRDGVISIDYKVEMKQNAYPWDDFEPLYTRGDRLTRDFFIDFAKRGIKEVTFELGVNIYRIRVTEMSQLS